MLICLFHQTNLQISVKPLQKLQMYFMEVENSLEMYLEIQSILNQQRLNVSNILCLIYLDNVAIA